MRFHAVCHTLEKYIRELYSLETGAVISEPNKKLRFGDVFFTRRQIKHVIESRKAEGRSVEYIIDLFLFGLAIINDFDFSIPNTDQKSYPGSIMRIKNNAIIILDREEQGRRAVITLFVRNARSIKMLKKKKL